MLTLGEQVVGYIQNFVDENTEESPESPVEVTLALEDSSHPVVYDPYNDRMKLYGVSAEALEELVETDPGDPLVSKVTAYARPGEMERWEKLGFRKEGVIRGFFVDGDAHLWATYPDDGTDRESSSADRDKHHNAGVRVAQSKENIDQPELDPDYRCTMATVADASVIAYLMTDTFPDYPSPISQEIVESQITSRSNHFRVIYGEDGRLAAVASAEIDHERKSVEMTDCATRATDRGRGLMLYLLKQLERDVFELYRIRDMYTLARADEIGMNCVFSKLGYEFSGRLVNNCRMPNGWESMNVWCKRLEP